MHDKLALHLRVDGLIVYTSGFIAENPDDLLAAARARGYGKNTAFCQRGSPVSRSPGAGVEKADDIIARLEESDVNVQWAYMLKGDYYYDHGKFAERKDGSERRSA